MGRIDFTNYLKDVVGTTMPVALITTEELVHSSGPHLDLLSAAGFEVAFPRNPEFARGLCSEEESVRELSVADALIAGSEFVTASMLGQLPKLRAIARTGVGYDRIDVDAATEANVVVTITPTAVHDAAAEHTLALLFAVCKDVARGDQITREGKWPRRLVRPVRGNTLGILGLGRIGRATAVRAIALGMQVIAYDEFPQDAFASEHGIRLVDFQTLISSCDMLSIHCPMNADTIGLVDADVFASMKPDAILINTARGPIVKEADLIQALREGVIAAAGLDVYEQEPPSPDNPLFELDNVVLTPHVAGCDSKSMQDMANEAASNVVKLHQGEWPSEAVVNRSLADANWRW